MLFLITYIACLVGFAGICALAALSDFKRMQIPNVYSIVIVALFVPAFMASLLSGANILGTWQSHLISFAIIFVLTIAMFFAKAIGGGDSKLASAVALWAGLQNLMSFLFYMSLAGVVLSVCAILIRKYKPFKNAPAESWIGRAQGGAGEDAGGKSGAQIPYGIAIFAGMLAMLITGDYFGMEDFAKFLQG